MSPGLEMSSVAVRPSGDEPEYVFPKRETSQPGSICFFSNPEHLPDSERELPVRLVEDDVFEIRGLHLGLVHDALGRAQDVLEVGGVAREPAAVSGIVLVFAPPEIRACRSCRNRSRAPRR